MDTVTKGVQMIRLKNNLEAFNELCYPSYKKTQKILTDCSIGVQYLTGNNSVQYLKNAKEKSRKTPNQKQKEDKEVKSVKKIVQRNYTQDFTNIHNFVEQ